MTENGGYTEKDLQLWARRAALDAAKDRGYKFGRSEWWAVLPTQGGICLQVQVTAHDGVGERFAQFPTNVAL